MAASQDWREVSVRCECGFTTVVSKPGFIEAITCENCGRKVPLHDRNTTVLVQDAGGGLDPGEELRLQLHRAHRLAREGHYYDAINAYNLVLKKHAQHRDALYGLGYSYYKVGRLEESEVSLMKACELGHPNAGRLFEKVGRRIAEKRAQHPSSW